MKKQQRADLLNKLRTVFLWFKILCLICNINAIFWLSLNHIYFEGTPHSLHVKN